MATRNHKANHKILLEVGEIKTWKKVKFILNGSSSQSSNTTTSAGVIKKSNCNDVEKEKCDLESKLLSAGHRIDDKAPPDKLGGSEKDLEGGVIQSCIVLASKTEMNLHVSNQGDCVEPSPTSAQSRSSFNITLEDDDSLKHQAAELRKKIKWMNHKLQKYADLCMELNDDNELILDELKKVSQPSVIRTLEARNPYNNPESD